MKKIRLPTRGAKAGFTLIELLVVVLIIGILAAIAVPQYFKVVEKGKFSEAASIMDTLRSAEERYLSTSGNYCVGATSACVGWDVQLPVMKYFSAPTITAGTTAPSWKATVTRNQNVALYTQYVVTYDVEPGAAPSITCSQTNCSSDLVPQ